MQAQDVLIIMRTILAATIRVVNAAFGWCPECNRHLQRPDRQITLHAIAHSLANHTPARSALGKLRCSVDDPGVGPDRAEHALEATYALQLCKVRFLRIAASNDFSTTPQVAAGLLLPLTFCHLTC